MLPLSHRTALRELEERIEEEARSYSEIHTRLRQLEQRVNHFLDVYCRRIWQKEVSAPMPMADTSAVASPLLKSLHRTLVKAYHPDQLPAGETLTEFTLTLMTEISTAYREADLIRLQRAYFHYLLREAGSALSTQRARLLEYQNEILDARTRLEEEYTQLLASPEYALMQKAVRAQMQGIDLAEIVSAQREESK